MVKFWINFSLEILWYYMQNLRNEKLIVTIYSILLYSKYFLSYFKISSVFSDFQQICQNRHLFGDYSKSICRRAKWSIWLQSAFHSANFAYNIIKFREKNLSKVLPYWPILTGPWPERKVIEKIWKKITMIFGHSRML